jgi:hypothetical protein
MYRSDVHWTWKIPGRNPARKRMAVGMSRSHAKAAPATKSTMAAGMIVYA